MSFAEVNLALLPILMDKLERLMVMMTQRDKWLLHKLETLAKRANACERRLKSLVKTVRVAGFTNSPSPRDDTTNDNSKDVHEHIGERATAQIPESKNVAPYIVINVGQGPNYTKEGVPAKLMAALEMVLYNDVDVNGISRPNIIKQMSAKGFKDEGIVLAAIEVALEEGRAQRWNENVVSIFN